VTADGDTRGPDTGVIAAVAVVVVGIAVGLVVYRRMNKKEKDAVGLRGMGGGADTVVQNPLGSEDVQANNHAYS
jgi:hypothetical protein